jgi:hypothetical protein
LVTVTKGAKKFLVVVGVIFLLFLVINEPTQSASMVRGILSSLESGANRLGDFIQSLVT